MSAGLMWQPASRSTLNKAAGAETYSLPAPAFQPEVSPRRLTLVPPYTAPRTAPQVYWKRRLVAVAALITLVVGAWSLVGMGASLVSSRTAAPATAATGLGSASPAAQSNSLTWTVRPGDTLWGIARSLKPSGDIRTVLDPLMKKYSGQPLQVGQTLTVVAE